MKKTNKKKALSFHTETVAPLSVKTLPESVLENIVGGTSTRLAPSPHGTSSCV